MFIKEFIAALIITIIFSSIYVAVRYHKIRRTGFLWFFLLFLMITWAGGIWLQPFGPTWFGIFWMPFVIAAVGFLLVAILLSHDRPPYGRQETLEKLEQMAQEKELEKATYLTLEVLFWAIIASLGLVIILRHMS